MIEYIAIKSRSVTLCPHNYKGYKNQITTVGSWVCKQCENFIEEKVLVLGKDGFVRKGLIKCKLEQIDL